MIGKEISHYKILEKLGEGGMGVVYKAEDTKLKRTVALKFLPPHLTRDSEAKERFLHEAQAAAALNHPNIVTVHEIGETEEQIFIVMEYVEGRSLQTRMDEARAAGQTSLSIDEAAGIAEQMAEGLQKAHDAGIVHRDLKPANIFIDESGRVKILDFGLAKLRGTSKLTKEESTLGTVHYMSPEQVRGADVDHRSDIWSFACVFYEMMTGEPPFKGEYEQAVFYSVLNEDPPPIASAAEDIPADLAELIDRALAKAPEDRHHSMGDILAALRVGGHAPTAREPGDRAQPPRKRRKRLYLYPAISILLLILLALQFDFFAPQPQVIDSIAVLPLDNLSEDPEKEYFADGMTEALITELSRIRALRVISRTSIMRYKNSDKNLPDIARELGVDAIVEGSAMLAGGQVRITAQLIEAATDRHLWAESYQQDLRDVLSLQKEVARAIAQEIRVAVTPEEQNQLSESRPVDPEVHEAYLKGRFFLNKWTQESVATGMRYFEKAIEKDPSYAPAYAGLAEAYDVLVSFRWMAPSEGWAEVKAKAERALEIDDTLAEAHALLADAMYTHDWDLEGAERQFNLAVRFNPNSTLAHHWYAYYLSAMGRHDEAVAEIRRARELDPLSVGVSRSVGTILYIARRYDEAIEALEETLALDPGFAKTRQSLGWTYLEKGMWNEAIAEFEETARLSSDSLWVAALARVYAESGDQAKAQELLSTLIAYSKTNYVPPTDFAMVYGSLGQKDEAIQWLNKAYEDRSTRIIWLKVDPGFDSLRSDPRFTRLLDKVGLQD